MINVLPLSCVVSSLSAELTLSFVSGVLCQQRCWRRKGLSLPGSDALLHLVASVAPGSAVQGSQQHLAASSSPASL